jgi:leader peptidase (prepilin peptidase)/N-methyltransferase
MFLAVLLGAVVGVGLLLTRRASRRSAIPYGPFLLAGTLIGCLAAQALSGAYLHVTGV